MGTNTSEAARKYSKRIIIYPEMERQIRQHGKETGCTTFAESLRDLVRAGLSASNARKPASFRDNIQHK